MCGALSITALLVFTTLNLFVCPMLEIWYGAGFGILLYSFLQKDVFAKKDYVWIPLLELTVLFSHPENFIIVLLFTLLDIERRRTFNRMHVMLFFIFIMTGLFKYFTLDSYEGDKVKWDYFTVFNAHHYKYLLNASYVKDIAVLLIKIYWVLLLLMAVTTIKYILSRKYARGAIVLSCFTGTVVLVNSVDSNNTFSFYGSIIYMPLVSIAVVPFL